MLCTKCGIEKTTDEFNIRHDRGYHYRQCRTCMAARKWAKRNPDRAKASAAVWIKANPAKAREVWRDMRARRMENPSTRTHTQLASEFHRALRGISPYRATFAMLGYSLNELRIHIEALFKPGMSWDNIGSWHLDHIKPLSLFVVHDRNDPLVLEAWALSNLQPLWAKDNLLKSNTYVE